MTIEPAEVHVPEVLVSLTLVPVEVFGGCDHPGCADQCGTFGYGLSDAVSAWSDCNRADGRIYRVDEPDSQPYRNPGETVQIWIKAEDAEFFKSRFGDSPREGKPMRRCGHCAADLGSADG